MAKVNSIIEKQPYRVKINSESGNTLLSDEPIDQGGQDLGFSPKELLISSLAACTSATLRMYADRKGWELEAVQCEIDLVRNEAENNTQITRKIELIGSLTPDQYKKLLAVANACPIHKILSNPIQVETSLID